MEDFMYTAQKAFRKYKIEIILIGLAFLITVISGGMYMQQSATDNNSETIVKEKELAQPTLQPTKELAQKMYVYISGSIEKPDMYEINPETRLKHIVDKAGGLSEQADLTYFAQYINLAKKMQDQEKIYIPSILDVANGFIEKPDSIISEANANTIQNSSQQEASSKININSASLSELEELPSVGAVTAQKIIDNRPYTNIGELLDKKVVSQSLFDKITDLIE